MPLTQDLTALAELGTRLRALHDASPDTIAAELASVAAAPAPDTADPLQAEALTSAREQFLARARALLQECEP